MQYSFKHSPTTREGRIERAIATINHPLGFMADKQAFLKGKGVTDDEFMEALNAATNGELLRAAGID